MNHTPGPWKVYDGMDAEIALESGWVLVVCRNNAGRIVANVNLNGGPGSKPMPCMDNARLIAAAPEMHAALLEIAATTTNGNSDPDRMADALGEIQGIVRRVLEATKKVPSTPNLAEQVRTLRGTLADNLQAWEGEEESVRDEHAYLIEETRAALEATKERP